MNSFVGVDAVVAQLAARDDFVVCGHVSPDGDCLGSGLALGAALRALGKNVTCLLATGDPVDYALQQLPGMQDAVVAGAFTGTTNTFVSVDVPNVKRMGDDAAALHSSADYTIAIDHHLSDAPMAQATYVDAESPACSMLVWDIIARLGVARDVAMASCCYVGLMTDTGRFQYQNTTAAALAAASEMVAAGADPAELAKLVYQNRSLESMALEERMLAHKELVGDGQFALSYLTIEDFVQTGATRADAEPLIDVLRCIRDVRVACLLREAENTVRGSLRAKDSTDVAAIARQWDGGGHVAAAGFTFAGTIDEALAAVRACFEEQAR